MFRQLIFMPFDTLKKFGKGETRIEIPGEVIVTEVCETLTSIIKKGDLLENI